MARPSELVIGYCYFMLGYFDSELLVPGVTTLRYLGVDATGPERLWRFQSWGADDGSELVLTDEQLSQVSDLGGLMGELQALSLLHPREGARSTFAAHSAGRARAARHRPGDCKADG